jgi:hypothetical protein
LKDQASTFSNENQIPATSMEDLDSTTPTLNVNVRTYLNSFSAGEADQPCRVNHVGIATVSLLLNFYLEQPLITLS